MDDTGEVVAVERHPGRAAALERTVARMRTTCVRVEVGDAAIREHDGAVRPGAGRSAVQRARHASVHGPICAGARAPRRSRELAALQARILAAGARGAGPGRVARLLGVHDLARRERGRGRGIPARSRRFRPRGARPSCCRTATGPTGSSSPGSAGGDPPRRPSGLSRPSGPLTCVITVTDPMPKLGPECPGCGEPWLRPTAAPGRYRCVYCLQRYELVSVCPNCGEHSTIVRMSSTAVVACNHCHGSMLRAVYVLTPASRRRDPAPAARAPGRPLDPVGRLRPPRRAGATRCSPPARG